VDVDANGANNGTSWTNAFEYLQDALATANAGDDIWVAAGVYKPTSTADRSISFLIPAGVDLYGGFNGTEINQNDRNWSLNVTVLSGAIGDQTTTADNSYIIVKIGNNVGSPILVDGFTVRRAYYEFVEQNGAAVSINQGELLLRHCMIYDNECVQSAAISSCNSVVTIDNCLIRDNRDPAASSGKIISNLCGGSMSIVETTIVQNSATSLDKSIVGITGGSTTHIFNSVIWDNEGAELFDDSLGAASHSIIEGGFSGLNVMDVDPLFVDAATNNFALQLLSPARNAGLVSASLSVYDIAKSTRIVSGTVDMGCYEDQTLSLIYVDHSAVGANNGSSWTNAYTDLSTALIVAIPGKEIWVSEGTYKPTAGADRNLSFTL